MSNFIIMRLLQSIVVILFLTFLVFTAMRLLPGDPLLIYLTQGEIINMDDAAINDLRHEWGLDKSIPSQYCDWILNVLSGDLGKSIISKDNVTALLLERMPVTIYIGVTAISLGAIIGIIFGIICALRRGKWIDTILTFLANIGITAPPFWTGILLIYLLSLKLKWLPVQGYTSPFEDFWMSIKSIIMPVFCLSLFCLASMARQTRSSMLEVIRQDYIRTAISKGLKEKVVILRHTVKNALIPVITMLGMQVRVAFGGSVIIETVFNVPGFGRLMVESVFAQDYQIVQGGVMILALLIIIVNLFIDISYAWLDPRIRYS